MRKSSVVVAAAAFVIAGMAISADAKKGGNSPAQKTRVYNSASVSVQPASTTVPNTISVRIKNVDYTVNVSSTTKLLRRYNGTAQFSEIMNGDNLKIWGTLDLNNSNTINATKIRDNSIKKLGASFQGTVNADISNELLTTPIESFTVHTKKYGDQTVNVPPTFSIKIYKHVSRLVSDLHQGDQIIVKGIWNTNTDNIYDVSWIKIKSLATVAATVAD